MKKILTYVIFIAVIIFSGNPKVFAQVVNNGVTLFLDQNAVLYIGDKYVNKSGTVKNNGEMILAADWENNGSSAFDLASSGLVKFTAKYATLYGTGATSFPKLSFSGKGVFEIKSDVYARLSLDLDDAELQLKDSQLTLENYNPTVLYRNKGFINTIGKGLFVRVMANNQTYLYPLGSSKLDLMRFVSLKPKDGYILGVSMLDKDATMDGYGRMSKTASVSDINDSYYHTVKNIKGNGIVDVNFFTSSNEKFNNLVNWTSAGIWDKVASVKLQDNMAFAPSLNKMLNYEGAKFALNVEVPFALANVSSVSQLSFYNAFSPDGDGKNDTWEVKNIDVFPDNDLKVFDRSGNLVYRVNSYNSSKYWDGNNVASGTYMYILRVKIDGKDEYFKGSITMVKN